MFLDIHLERCDDRGERLKKIAEAGRPFAISVVPVLLLPEHEVFRTGIYPSDYYYPKEMVAILKELSKNSEVVFGQQGFFHYCPKCFSVREKHDPWHENRCLYGEEKSVGEQAAIMGKGKEVVEDILGVSPAVYSTPNHQFDDNTKKAAGKLSYKYFADKAVINVAPYTQDGLVILPERKLHQRGNIFYTHYDQITENLQRCFKIIESSEPLECLVLKASPARIFLNERLKIAEKRLRDINQLKNKNVKKRRE